eukprot:GSMAST32.ASY1.ANO1.1358.1 assembled CDS
MERNIVQSTQNSEFVLDRSIFSKSIPVSALRIRPEQCNVFTKKLRRIIFKRRKVRPIVSDPSDSTHKLLLLSDTIGNHNGNHNDDISPEIMDFITSQGASFVPYSITMGYEHLTASQVLAEVLPVGVQVPSSFETIGHIAHVNLLEEQLPFKKIIGEVFLEKNSPRIRTVVNKVGTIQTKFRTFPMEILAGEDDTIVECIEGGARFKLDYRSVYWNSRLQMEHMRRVELIAVIADMMCGIGPFAIPLAMRDCVVHANDLNPESFFLVFVRNSVPNKFYKKKIFFHNTYLKENCALNKVSSLITTYNLDARVFIKTLLKQSITFDHVIMNLPALSLEFIDVFSGQVCADWEKMPKLHCYCFSSASTVTERRNDVIKRAEISLGRPLDSANVQTKEVRDVAPNKIMYVLFFFNF